MSVRAPRSTPTIPTSDLTALFEQSVEVAKGFNHVYVNTEHLLMALLRCQSVRDKLRFWSVDAAGIERALRQHMDQLPVAPSRHATPRPSAAFMRVIAQVASHPCRMSSTGPMLLDALLHEDESRAVAILRAGGLEILPPVREAAAAVDPTEATVDAVVEKLGTLAQALPSERRAAVGKTISAFVQTPGSDCLKHALFSMLACAPTAKASTSRPRRVAA